jgi:hypothetical protein
LQSVASPRAFSGNLCPSLSFLHHAQSNRSLPCDSDLSPATGTSRPLFWLHRAAASSLPAPWWCVLRGRRPGKEEVDAEEVEHGSGGAALSFAPVAAPSLPAPWRRREPPWPDLAGGLPPRPFLHVDPVREEANRSGRRRR